MENVFVSYQHGDAKYKNMLVAWSENDSNHFDIEFNDRSVGVSINSENATYIKAVIKGRIKNSDTLLCIIGEETADSDWVNWEVETAVALKKSIVAVKIDQNYPSPPAILGVGASWAMSFTYAAIKKSIDG